jgi:hypothetical protein
VSAPVLIPTIEWAKRAYDSLLPASSPSDAIAIARGKFGYHVRSVGLQHVFTDEEIRTGVCCCDECVGPVQMGIEEIS